MRAALHLRGGLTCLLSSGTYHWRVLDSLNSKCLRCRIQRIYGYGAARSETQMSRSGPADSVILSCESLLNICAAAFHEKD